MKNRDSSLGLLYQRAGKHLDRAEECPRDAHKAAEILQALSEHLFAMSQARLRVDEVHSSSPGTIRSIDGDRNHLRVMWPEPTDASAKADWNSALSRGEQGIHRPWIPFHLKVGEGERVARETYLIATFLEVRPGYSSNNNGQQVNVVAGHHEGRIHYEIRCPNSTEVVGTLEPAVAEQIKKEGSVS